MAVDPQAIDGFDRMAELGRSVIRELIRRARGVEWRSLGVDAQGGYIFGAYLDGLDVELHDGGKVAIRDSAGNWVLPMTGVDVDLLGAKYEAWDQLYTLAATLALGTAQRAIDRIVGLPRGPHQRDGID
jgi:hypothetical protein